MIQGSRLHKEKLALNCAMDNTSGLDGRANSSAFQHNNHGAAEFTDNHFASGMHRTDAPGPMQKNNEPKIPGQTGQTSDYKTEFMNDMTAAGKGPVKPKSIVSAKQKPLSLDRREVITFGDQVNDAKLVKANVGPMQEYVSDAQRKAVHASKADGGKPYKYKNGYHLPKKKTKGPYLETERDVMSGGDIAKRAALSGVATGGVGAAVSLIKNLRQRSKDKAYNAGFEQSDSDAMEL